MDFFAHLIDSWLWFVYFSFTSKETRQNPSTAPINVKIIHSFSVLRGFVIREKRKKSQDGRGKDVCNSLEIRIKLKLAPTSRLRIGTFNWKLAPMRTLRIGTINWKFFSNKTPKFPGLYYTQFTCWRPRVQVPAGGAYRFVVLAWLHIWWCILLLNKG